MKYFGKIEAPCTQQLILQSSCSRLQEHKQRSHLVIFRDQAANETAKEILLKLSVIIGTHKPFTEGNTLTYESTLKKNVFYEFDSLQTETMDSVACKTLFFSFVTFLASRRKSRNNTNASTNYVSSNLLGRFLALFFGFLG